MTFSNRVDEIYATAPPETFDMLALKDGRTFERFATIHVVDGREVGRVWSFRDSTIRKHNEEALREETRILEVLTETGTARSHRSWTRSRCCRRCRMPRRN